MENYKILKDFPKYKIYSNGKVWSDFKKGYLTPQIRNKGYLAVTLYSENKRQHFLLHRLIATLFIQNPNNLPDVNHKDQDKTNNDVSNLEWCTKKYNNDYGTRTERIAKAHSKKIFCVELNKIFNSAAEAGQELKIDPSSIRKVCNGKRKSAGGYHWKEIEKNS